MHKFMKRNKKVINLQITTNNQFLFRKMKKVFPFLKDQQTRRNSKIKIWNKSQTLYKNQTSLSICMRKVNYMFLVLSLVAFYISNSIYSTTF
jgi:hypothetical protein